MKTAVSIPDRIFREADLLARRAHKSRSRLYADALREYVDRHAADKITEAMNRVCDSAGEDESSAFRVAAARRVLKNTEW
jgi:metal-responsive CopG/Arc/MetJ family transcriptional regulator